MTNLLAPGFGPNNQFILAQKPVYNKFFSNFFAVIIQKETNSDALLETNTLSKMALWKQNQKAIVYSQKILATI